MIWREKRWLLISLGIFLLANLVFFLTYRVRFEQRVSATNERLDQATQGLQEARADRAAAEAELKTYRQVMTASEQVYRDWWGTSDERLGAILIEMRDLARKSELPPRSVSYGQAAVDRPAGEGAPTAPSGNTALTGTSALTISFGVSGSYQQVRRLINLIELSDQFIVIDEIGLNEIGSSGQLNLTLQLRTLFADRNAPTRSTS